jgi:hypothetical protein
MLKKSKHEGRPRLDSVFSSGRDTVFASGKAPINGAEMRRKEEPPVPWPWPNEETIMLTDKEKSRLRKESRKMRRGGEE